MDEIEGSNMRMRAVSCVPRCVWQSFPSRRFCRRTWETTGDVVCPLHCGGGGPHLVRRRRSRLRTLGFSNESSSRKAFSPGCLWLGVLCSRGACVIIVVFSRDDGARRKWCTPGAPAIGSPPITLEQADTTSRGCFSAEVCKSVCVCWGGDHEWYCMSR